MLSGVVKWHVCLYDVACAFFSPLSFWRVRVSWKRSVASHKDPLRAPTWLIVSRTRRSKPFKCASQFCHAIICARKDCNLYPAGRRLCGPGFFARPSPSSSYSSAPFPAATLAITGSSPLNCVAAIFGEIEAPSFIAGEDSVPFSLFLETDMLDGNLELQRRSQPQDLPCSQQLRLS